MRSKTSKKEFEFNVPVTDFSKRLKKGYPFLGNLLIVGKIIELKDATPEEEQLSAKLSHIIWNDVNILPLVKATSTMQVFHSDLIDYAVKLHSETLNEA